MPQTINEIQQLQFELIRKVSFNNFDGEKIVQSLIDYKELWRGVVMNRLSTSSQSDPFLPLRDIEKNIWSVDTISILPTEGESRQLEKLAKSKEWNADDVFWVPASETKHLLGISNSSKILNVWWD